jgi:magnesium-transporting ATPase (P-type)
LASLADIIERCVAAKADHLTSVEHDLVFAGYGMIDPLRAEARDAARRAPDRPL